MERGVAKFHKGVVKFDKRKPWWRRNQGGGVQKQ